MDKQEMLGLPLAGDSTAQLPWITKLTVIRADDSAAETFDTGTDSTMSTIMRTWVFRGIDSNPGIFQGNANNRIIQNS